MATGNFVLQVLNSPAQGQALNYSFHGAVENSPVSIYVQGGGGLTVTSDSRGGGSGSFVDNDLPGAYTLVARDSLGRQATAQFNVLTPSADTINNGWTIEEQRGPVDSSEYQTVVEVGSISQLKSEVPAIQDIPPGTKIKIEFQLPSWMPIAGIANIAGMEWCASFFTPGTMTVDDVYSDGAHTIVILGTAEGVIVLVLIAILVALLTALGIAMVVAHIKVSADKTKIASLKATVATVNAQEAVALVQAGLTPQQITDIFAAQTTATAAVEPEKDTSNTLGDIGSIIKWGIIGFLAFQLLGVFKTSRGTA